MKIEDIKFVFFLIVSCAVIAVFFGALLLGLIVYITNNNFANELGHKVEPVLDHSEKLYNQNIRLDGETIILKSEPNNQFTYSGITDKLPDKIQPKRDSFGFIENPIHFVIVISDIKEVILGLYKVQGNNAVVKGYGYEFTLTIIDLDENKILTIEKMNPTRPSTTYVSQPQDFYQSYDSDVMRYVGTIV